MSRGSPVSINSSNTTTPSRSITRRLADCFAAVDFFEDRGLPYVIGLNCFDGVLNHSVDDVRDALAIDPAVPIVSCDARDRESTKHTLIALVEHAMRRSVAARA